ncbi:MAG: single-stranded-DNA-specific exonuclease RecJ [Chloroflexota bacterium]|nr:single-stranded-DNA-specific exonuclease RecJ [Chloroflexota bacterium]
MADNGALPQPTWVIAPRAPDEVVDALRLPRLWAQLLYNRGIETRDMAWELLHASEDALHDPFLFSEMDSAVDRTMAAVEGGETIAVYGDFDTDGVTASALLYESLLALGGDAFVHLPHRVRDGHGLNGEAVTAMAEYGASLVITVDCGITSAAEVRQARELGMDVILTDHHAPIRETPEAFAMVTPTDAYPFPFLTGAGLAFKLVQAIHRRLETPVPGGALELASLGTVADMAPLLGENRAIATLGLERLRETERPGLLALLASAGVARESLDHESIPFVIAPRLNAAGRMESAELAFSLLTAEDPEEAQELATRIEALNQERRSLTQELLDEGMRIAAPQVEAGERLLFIAGEQFNPGVSGLVAGRLVERFSRPAVVVAVDGDVARASGRSTTEFHLARALAEHSERFLHFGGHPAAAGFVARTEELDGIGRSLQGLARERLREASLEPTLRVDAEAGFAEMPGQTMGFLRKLAPFGQENPPPAFLTRSASVVDVRRMGGEGQHLRLQLRQGGSTWEAVAFNRAWPEDVSERGRIDVVYTPEVNVYNGRQRLQMRVLDLRAAG